MKKLESGDTAYIKWQDRHGVYLPPEPVLIVNMPRGEGDLVQVQYSGGLVQAFSPSRTDFVLESQ